MVRKSLKQKSFTPHLTLGLSLEMTLPTMIICLPLFLVRRIITTI